MRTKMSNGKRKPKVVVVPPGLHEELMGIKRRTGRSIAFLTDEALRDFIRKDRILNETHTPAYPA